MASIELDESGLEQLLRFASSGEKNSLFSGIGCRCPSTFGAMYERELERDETRLLTAERMDIAERDGEGWRGLYAPPSVSRCTLGMRPGGCGL